MLNFSKLVLQTGGMTLMIIESHLFSHTQFLGGVLRSYSNHPQKENCDVTSTAAGVKRRYMRGAELEHWSTFLRVCVGGVVF